jgi:hypothetical protein
MVGESAVGCLKANNLTCGIPCLLAVAPPLARNVFAALHTLRGAPKAPTHTPKKPQRSNT